MTSPSTTTGRGAGSAASCASPATSRGTRAGATSGNGPTPCLGGDPPAAPPKHGAGFPVNPPPKGSQGGFTEKPSDSNGCEPCEPCEPYHSNTQVRDGVSGAGAGPLPRMSVAEPGFTGFTPSRPL